MINCYPDLRGDHAGRFSFGNHRCSFSQRLHQSSEPEGEMGEAFYTPTKGSDWNFDLLGDPKKEPFSTVVESTAPNTFPNNADGRTHNKKEADKIECRSYPTPPQHKAWKHNHRNNAVAASGGFFDVRHRVDVRHR